jgi:hypothetical protein
MKFGILVPALLLIGGCVSVPPPDPITMDEIVSLSAAGADSPALVHALETRPLGFALSFENLKKLESRGVPPAVIDLLMSSTVDRRARALAPRYVPYWYDPWYPGPYWRFDFYGGYYFHHHHHR